MRRQSNVDDQTGGRHPRGLRLLTDIFLAAKSSRSHLRKCSRFVSHHRFLDILPSTRASDKGKSPVDAERRCARGETHYMWASSARKRLQLVVEGGPSYSESVRISSAISISARPNPCIRSKGTPLVSVRGRRHGDAQRSCPHDGKSGILGPACVRALDSNALRFEWCGCCADGPCQDSDSQCVPEAPDAITT